MTYLTRLLIACTITLCLHFNVQASSSTKLELPTLNSEKSYNLAKSHWLPDYQSTMQASSGGGSGNEAANCGELNLSSSDLGEKYDCRAVSSGNLDCFKCDCQSRFNTAASDCELGQILSTDCCGDKCNGCDDCPDKAELYKQGWRLEETCDDAARLRTKKTDCATYYTCCPSGYSATDFPTRAISITNSQKLVAHSTQTTCKKIENKICTDFNADYVTKKDTSKSCTATTDTGNLKCYSCKSCDATFKYDSTNCPGTPGTNTCNGKSDTCSCPKNTDCGTKGCKTFYSSPCGSICSICKAEEVCPIDQFKLPHNYVNNGVCYGNLETWINAGNLTLK